MAFCHDSRLTATVIDALRNSARAQFRLLPYRRRVQQLQLPRARASSTRLFRFANPANSTVQMQGDYADWGAFFSQALVLCNSNFIRVHLKEICFSS
jgi:hypothetical protein